METTACAGAGAFFNSLRGDGSPEPGLNPESLRRFLGNLRHLPRELKLPVLADIAALVPGSSAIGPPSMAGIPPQGILRERLERRYLRICFVQRELGRLDFSQAPGAGKGAAPGLMVRPGMNFNDLVFAQADFSVYRNISAAEFALFSGPGLEDYRDSFFEAAFRLNRKAVEAIIGGAYAKEGSGPESRFCLREEKLLRNPLFLSIMRNLHTSLDFAPLFTRQEVFGECSLLFRRLEAQALVRDEAFSRLAGGFDRFLYALILALQGGCMVHQDGMKTSLSVQTSGNRGAILRGAFHPQNKAYTIDLAAA